MKKFLVVAVFLLGLAFNAQARAYQTGDVLLGAAFVASPLELGTDWGEVNVDDERELALQFGVNSIPTVMVFQNGEIKATSVGYRPKEEIEQFLK